jgi:lipopolysaccharide transport system ATP-binding protein
MIVLKNIKKRFSSKEKKYIGRYFLRNIGSSILKGLKKESADDGHIYVLRDITLNIAPGEHVGIVGKNKAGKSTLLQLISGITEPSSGELRVEGKIIPVFGQGAISTPDLTGREYINLYAVALGTSKADIEMLEQNIIDFSGIKEIDTPVKFYSTGSRTRLSLAVTLLLPADIYILDEVFYGSDIFFKEKTAARLQEIQSDPNKTVIMVSHHEEILRTFCKRIILLQDGKIVMDDTTDKVLDVYKTAQ